MMDDMTD